MSTEVWILVATAVLAVVAIGAAVVAVRAVRAVRQASRLTQTVKPQTGKPQTMQPPVESRHRAEVVRHVDPPPAVPHDLEPHVVEGRLVIPPTQHQVVQAALGRPGVRLSVLAHGFAHALRPESRDRIAALMRRELRRRRRERLQAGRRAVRAARPSTPPAPSDPWPGA